MGGGPPRRQFSRRGSATGGEERDGGGASRVPSSIPASRRKKTTRRNRVWLQCFLGGLQSPAAVWRPNPPQLVLGLWLQRERNRKRERESNQQLPGRALKVARCLPSQGLCTGLGMGVAHAMACSPGKKKKDAASPSSEPLAPSKPTPRVG